MKPFIWMVVFIAAGSSGLLVAEDWYRFRGPQLNGRSSETQWSHEWPAGGPSIAWRAEVGTGFSSVVISENRLYTIGNRDNVDTIYCLDVQTGQPIWTHAYASPIDPNEFEGGPTSTPTIDGDIVFTLSRSGDLFAIDKRSGEVRWSKNIAIEAEVRVPAWGFSGAPLVHGRTLILNVGDAGVAVDKQSGEIIWASADKDAGYATPVPVLQGERQGIILGSSRSFVCVDPANGDELWRQRWLTTFGCNAADPIVLDGHVFLSSGYNRGSALLDLASDPPTVVWKHKEFQNQMATSVLIDGHLYGASGDVATAAELTCIDVMTGELRWREEGLSVGGLTAGGDRLIVLSEAGELIIAKASPTQFKVLARHVVIEGRCWTVPVLSGGRIYARNADGQVVCVDVGR